MALGTAFRAFFAALFDAAAAERIGAAIDSAAPVPPPAGSTAGMIVESAPPQTPVAPQSVQPLRSDAIALLGVLQREARFVDLVKENLAQFSDAQIGAAARPCLQQCASALDRMVGLVPIESSPDGSIVSVAESASAAHYQWIGEGESASGKLVHHGWTASKVELPHWTGNRVDAMVVAPAQIKRG